MTTAACAPLPLGLLIDRSKSPRWAGALFAAGTALGFALLAISEYPDRNYFSLGFGLFSFFGSGVQLNLFHVANLFPQGKGLVMGLFTTLFGFSALLPLFFFYIWEAMDDPDNARRVLFLWFSAVLGAFVLFALSVGDFYADGDRLTFSSRGFRRLAPAAEAGAEAEGEGAEAQPARRSLRADLTSPDFLAFLAFFSLHFFRSIFYLGTVDLQLASIAGPQSPSREHYVAVNGWMKPFGTLAGPPIGHVIHKNKHGAAICAAMVVLVSAVHGGAAMAGVLELMPLSFAGATLAEEGVVTILFAFVQDHFGFDNFGTLTGFVLFVNGGVAMLVYPLTNLIVDAHADGALDGEAAVPFEVWRRWWGGFLVLTLASAAYPVWLFRRTKTGDAKPTAKP